MVRVNLPGVTHDLRRLCLQESEPNVPRREVSEQLQTDLDALLARLIFIWGDTVEVRGVFNEIVSLYAKYAEVKADVRLSEEYVSN